jgi:very-short-patch-repair endonuclease
MSDEGRVARHQTMQQIGDVGFNLITKAIGMAKLGNNMGRGTTALDFGAAGFAHRAAAMGLSAIQIDQKSEELRAAYEYGQSLCESPIERDVLAALLTAPWSAQFGTIPPRIHNTKLQDALPKGDLIIVPQMAFVRYRVDFMVLGVAGDARQMVAIECDGADYHQDHGKDALRAAYFASWGIPVCRFRGTEIYADPDSAIRSAVNLLNDWRALRE